MNKLIIFAFMVTFVTSVVTKDVSIAFLSFLMIVLFWGKE